MRARSSPDEMSQLRVLGVLPLLSLCLLLLLLELQGIRSCSLRRESSGDGGDLFGRGGEGGRASSASKLAATTPTDCGNVFFRRTRNSARSINLGGGGSMGNTVAERPGHMAQVYLVMIGTMIVVLAISQVIPSLFSSLRNNNMDERTCAESISTSSKEEDLEDEDFSHELEEEWVGGEEEDDEDDDGDCTDGTEETCHPIVVQQHDGGQILCLDTVTFV